MNLIFKTTNLLNWNWITLEGPDSRDFLHRLTTVHVKALQPGQGSDGFFLNAQGRIRAYFTLWCLDETSFVFEFEGGEASRWKTELLQVIDQFTFGEKIKLIDRNSELASCWLFTDGESTQATEAVSPGLRLFHHGTNRFGRNWTTAWGQPDELKNWINQNVGDSSTVSLDEIESWRITQVQPRVDFEIKDLNSIPLELGLRSAIAENKGCYPGQEVIEKIISIGSPPRLLALIELAEKPSLKPGDSVFTETDPKMEIGKITSVAASYSLALALIRKTNAKENHRVRFSDSFGIIKKVTSYA